ncbi:aminotransferase class IV [Marivirga arenosa]|uniref:branched-chain-amino-acid transaminase n=1 Tax=Marivirga arenosa TaxID=3059076 RepID=A0AA49GGV1_9BACT|nr:aminotransferase class IV [Marivirga sp. BKB1-2]WKK81297.2 aminotransferase class IV [Marivirga sp. BKB1-2]
MINYNGRLTSSESIDFNNRGFQYGDGIFETLLCESGNIRFHEEHWERISEGLKILKIDFSISKEVLFNQVNELLLQNELSNKTARVKIYFWRKNGGLYTPTSSECNYLISADSTEIKEIKLYKNVALSESVALQYSKFSALKSISAIEYVLAGIEKKERALDELIILNSEGLLAEASAANLFFFDFAHKKLFTPSLKTGCINGVVRRFIMKNIKRHGFEIEEIEWKLNEIPLNYSVFTVNVVGVNQLLKVGNQHFNDSHEDLKSFLQLLKA